MNGAFRRVMYWVVKIGVMAILLGVVWKRLSGLLDGADFWEVMSLLWGIAGMGFGVSIGLTIFSNIRSMPGWLTGILLLAFTLIGSLLVEALMMLIYGILIDMFAEVIAIVIAVLMILGMAGWLLPLLMMFCFASLLRMLEKN